MSFANKFNQGKLFDIDTEKFKYKSLKDLFAKDGGDKVHTLDGFFFNSGKYGVQPIAISVKDKSLINLPNHTETTFKDIATDDDAVQTIKDGKVGFKIYQYESHGKECYNITFVDL